MDPDTDTNADGNEGSAGSGNQQGNTDTDGTAGSETNQGDDRQKKREAKPERFMLHGLKLPKHPDRVQKLLKECRTLELEVLPSVACVMLRVVVELSVSSPEALALSGARESDSLRSKIIGMLRYLDPHIEHPAKRDKGLEQAYVEASELGIQYLNGFVHNPRVTPDPHLARRFSAAFRPFLERVDDAL